MPASAFHRLIHRIASTPAGARVFRVAQRHLDPPVWRLTRGATTLTTIMSGLPVVVVTSTGAKSGQPRVSFLAYVRDPLNADRFAIIGTNHGQPQLPAWYFNLQANPLATCNLLGAAAVHRYRAREAAGTDYARFWNLAVALYPGFAAYAKRLTRPIPVLILERMRE